MSSLRVVALRRERERLLREIKQRRRELQRSMQKMAETLSASRERLAPILALHREVELEVHALFADLLSDRKLPKLRRAELKRLYRSLESQGVLDAPPARDVASHAEDVDEGDDLPPGGGYSAPRPDEGDGARLSLRALFKRLALALHPDRVQHEEEKALRTEAMKEVTRAYETGDLARLIEIEERWVASSKVDSADSVEAIEESLARTVAELKNQLREVLGELRALRRSEPFRAAQSLRRVAATGVDPAEVFVVSAERDLDRLSDIRNCLHAFVAGRLSWDDLLSAPSWYADDDELDPEFEP